MIICVVVIIIRNILSMMSNIIITANIIIASFVHRYCCYNPLQILTV